MRHALIMGLFLVVAAGGGVAAHHSFAMFDTAKPVTLTGMVTDVQWTNPHVYIELDATEGGRVARHWSIELGSPSILMRGGWKFNSVRKGDKVVALVSPRRSAEPGGLLTRITLPDGRTLGNGGPTGVGPGTTANSAPAATEPR